MGATVGALALSGCSSSSADECIIGTNGCLCFSNLTCDRGLECVSESKTCHPSTGASGGAANGGGSDGTDAGTGGGEEETGGRGGAGGSEAGAGPSAEQGGAGAGGQDSNGGEPGAAGTAGGPSVGGGAGLSGGGNAGSSDGGTAGMPSLGGAAGAAAGGAGASPGDGGTGGAAGLGGGGEGGTGEPMQELLTNGDFASGASGWEVSGGSGQFTADGRLCVYGSYNDNPYIGWPAEEADAFDLVAGGTYVLQFRVNGVSTGFDVKVGQAAAPYAQAYLNTDIPEVTDGWEQVRLEVDVPSDWGADNDGVVPSGLLFIVWFSQQGPQTELCIDDVSFVRAS